MKRTTIMLPQYLKLDAGRKAQQMGISLGELIREALSGYLDASKKAQVKEQDPFFADKAVWTGKVPRDGSANIDKYLYDEMP